MRGRRPEAGEVTLVVCVKGCKQGSALMCSKFGGENPSGTVEGRARAEAAAGMRGDVGGRSRALLGGQRLVCAIVGTWRQEPELREMQGPRPTPTSPRGGPLGSWLSRRASGRVGESYLRGTRGGRSKGRRGWGGWGGVQRDVGADAGGGVRPARHHCPGSPGPQARAGPKAGATQRVPPQPGSTRSSVLESRWGPPALRRPQTGPGRERSRRAPRNLRPPPPAFAAGPVGGTRSLLLRGGPGSDAPRVC